MKWDEELGDWRRVGVGVNRGVDFGPASFEDVFSYYFRRWLYEHPEAYDVDALLLGREGSFGRLVQLRLI